MNLRHFSSRRAVLYTFIMILRAEAPHSLQSRMSRSMVQIPLLCVSLAARCPYPRLSSSVHSFCFSFFVSFIPSLVILDKNRSTIFQSEIARVNSWYWYKQSIFRLKTWGWILDKNNAKIDRGYWCSVLFMENKFNTVNFIVDETVMQVCNFILDKSQISVIFIRFSSLFIKWYWCLSLTSDPIL